MEFVSLSRGDSRPDGWTSVSTVACDWAGPRSFEERFPEPKAGQRRQPLSFEGRFPAVRRPEPSSTEVPSPVPPRARHRRGRPAQGLVSTYVIGIEGSPLVKIGYTSVKPEERRGQLQTGLPFQLTLLWSTSGDFESQLHDMFAEHRVRGEWFDLTSLGDPLQVVRSAVQQISTQSVIR